MLGKIFNREIQEKIKLHLNLMCRNIKNVERCRKRVDKMKINSFRKSVLSGLIYGMLTFAVYVLYTSILNGILAGENFIYKDETRDIVNGLSFVTTQIIATILSALIPILLLRYKTISYYIASVFIAVSIYIIMLLGMFIAPGFSNFFFEIIKGSPMNSFDAIVYGIFNFPLGATIGILINVGINFILNKKQ